MTQTSNLLATVALGLVGAFTFGVIARSLRLPPIVGYLVAGVLIGPHTPGLVADTESAVQLAEIGVILLMFGVGLHFNYRDLLAVARVAVPGAIARMIVATGLGTVLGLQLGWSLKGAVLFGLALSVASTVVLLRSLEERQLLDTRTGHVAIGWLIVEDLAMVVALVVIPVLATGSGDGAAGSEPASFGVLAQTLAWTLVRIGGFVAFMFIVGRRVVPWILARVARTGSRELFTLGVLAIGLGVAVGAAALFNVSFALGAFFAGMVLKESELSQRAADDSLPLRDAFAVLFFVSVGMLANPSVITEQPLAVVVTLLIIVVGKAVIAFGLVKVLGESTQMAVVIGAALAQIGEFSFILVSLGLTLGVLPALAIDLVLAGAILSIVVNPLIFSLALAWSGRRRVRDLRADARMQATGGIDTPHSFLGTGHVIVVGYGRVGRLVSASLWDSRTPVVVVDLDPSRVEEIRAAGHDAICGNAARRSVLHQAGIESARLVLVALPNGIEAGEVVAKARKLHPNVPIVARTHQHAEIDYLSGRGATRVVMGELEIARVMLAEATGSAPD